jgi:beta-lactamase class A
MWHKRFAGAARWACTVAFLSLFPAHRPAQAGPGAPAAAVSVGAPKLQALVDDAAAAALRQFASRLQSNQLALTLIDLTPGDAPAQAGFRGGEPMYPASVIKLFYLAAAHRWLEDGKLADTEELRRALRDMIVDSCNEATHYVVDVLTGTTSGPELAPDAMREWELKRNAVNRYFAALGYERLNINQKPWCEGPYGRERVFVGQRYENRNQLTTQATARLLAEIVRGRAISPPRSAAMVKLLERDPAKKAPPGGEPDQNVDFTAPGLPPGAKLWSKAGWTSTVRHDAAYVELPDARRFVLVTFTCGHSHEREIIPTVVRTIISQWPGMTANAAGK